MQKIKCSICGNEELEIIYVSRNLDIGTIEAHYKCNKCLKPELLNCSILSIIKLLFKN